MTGEKRFGRGLYKVLLAVTGLLFGVLAAYSLFRGWILDPAQAGDYPLPCTDAVWPSLCAAAVLFLLAAGAVRLRISVKTAGLIAAGWVLAAGCAWVVILHASPRWDQFSCKQAGAMLLNGDLAALTAPDAYLTQHPHQLGFSLYAALMQAVFGAGSDIACGLLNAVFLALTYALILQMTYAVWGNRKLCLALCVLMGTCLQPVLMCSFLYGNLPGTAFAVLSVFFAFRRVCGGGTACGVLCAVCMLPAVWLKPNCQIAALALGMVLAVYAVRERRISLGVLALAVTVPALAAGAVLKALTECLAGVKFGTDIPMSAYLAMGLQDEGRLGGWYNGYTDLPLLEKAGYDANVLGGMVRENLTESLHRLASDPAEALRFFYRKVSSQWSETTFGCLQVNRGNLSFAERPEWVRSLITGQAAGMISVWCEGWTVTVYAGTALGTFRLLRQKKAAPEKVFPAAAAALTLLGAFAYHFLFEAKSQYVFMYLPLILPFAVCAFFGDSAKKETNGNALRKSETPEIR